MRRCLHALGQLYAPPPSRCSFARTGDRRIRRRLISVPAGSKLRRPSTGVYRWSWPVVRLRSARALCRRRSACTSEKRSTILETAPSVSIPGLRARCPGWSAVWIANPTWSTRSTTTLADIATALSRLPAGMVGSRISRVANGIVHAPGLAWRKWRAWALSVGRRTPSSTGRHGLDVDRGSNSPSASCSMHRTRAASTVFFVDGSPFCLRGPSAQGLRAGRRRRRLCAHDRSSMKAATIGKPRLKSSRRRSAHLSVCLDYRNRLRFVDRHFPAGGCRGPCSSEWLRLSRTPRQVSHRRRSPAQRRPTAGSGSPGGQDRLGISFASTRRAAPGHPARAADDRRGRCARALRRCARGSPLLAWAERRRGPGPADVIEPPNPR